MPQRQFDGIYPLAELLDGFGGLDVHIARVRSYHRQRG